MGKKKITGVGKWRSKGSHLADKQPRDDDEVRKANASDESEEEVASEDRTISTRIYLWEFGQNDPKRFSLFISMTVSSLNVICVS